MQRRTILQIFYEVNGLENCEIIVLQEIGFQCSLFVQAPAFAAFAATANAAIAAAADADVAATTGLTGEL